ncbi:MAG TPA: ribonuclease P protein component [Candidatus Paceibacterota bacterium]|nr:ribonuclease P protein component [Candidatus Paceibacterota bacterium]HOV88803.1 ribonuclease P protein component [Candidatus Paceibacterota bacterium]HPP17188.1 ribonuclease P protein component [Candidatus Paceibacterota bacterium]
MKYHSLKKEKEFQRVFQAGKRINLPELTFIYLFHPDNPDNRLAVVASKKYFRQATQRNLIKRRLKAIISQIKLVNDGVDVIIIAKTPILARSFEELKGLLESTFQKAQLS